MLEYDDSAFYYFVLASMSCYALPSWCTILKRVVKAVSTDDNDIGAVARTTAEIGKVEAIRRTNKGLGTLVHKVGFIVNLLSTALATIVAYHLFVTLSQEPAIKSYDPHAVLGLDSGEDVNDIKSIRRAFHKLSITYHPDKCPPEEKQHCADKFIEIKNAYVALTDPEAVGTNPNVSSGGLSFGIGLPRVLLDERYHNLVLALYLLLFVVVVPTVVWRYYYRSSQLGDGNIRYETYAWFHHFLSEHTLLRGLPEIFAGSAEFRGRNYDSRPTSASCAEGRKEEMGKVLSTVRTEMAKPKLRNPAVLKGNALLHSHLLRKTDELPDHLRKDLNHMLKRSNKLIDVMISICKNHDGSWLETAVNCIRFGQCLAQACWIKDSSFVQLPHFTRDEVNQCKKGRKGKEKSIKEYLNVPDEEKLGLGSLTKEQRVDVLKCCSLLPQVEANTEVFVDDDEDDCVYEGDLLTIRVILAPHKNLSVDRQVDSEKRYVHAPYFPFPLQEAWWIILGTREGKIISLDKVMSDPLGGAVKHDIKFLAPKEGEYEFDLRILSNAYVGLDQRKGVKLSTRDPSDLPEHSIHDDDAALDNEPTLFEQMHTLKAANVEDDSDSDDDQSSDDGSTSSVRGDHQLSATPSRRKEEKWRARRLAFSATDEW